MSQYDFTHSALRDFWIDIRRSTRRLVRRLSGRRPHTRPCRVSRRRVVRILGGDATARGNSKTEAYNAVLNGVSMAKRNSSNEDAVALQMAVQQLRTLTREEERIFQRMQALEQKNLTAEGLSDLEQKQLDDLYAESDRVRAQKGKVTHEFSFDSVAREVKRQLTESQ